MEKGKRLVFVVQVDGTGKIRGPIAENMRKSLGEYFANKPVRIVFEGVPSGANYRDLVFFRQVCVKTLLYFFQELGDPVSAHSTYDQSEMEKELKKRFLAPKSQKDFQGQSVVFYPRLEDLPAVELKGFIGKTIEFIHKIQASKNLFEVWHQFTEDDEQQL